MPDLAAEGPVHVTVRFAEPLDPTEASHLTAQLNFGRHGNIAAKRMEFFVVTGEDDGAVHPAQVVDLLETSEAARTPE